MINNRVPFVNKDKGACTYYIINFCPILDPPCVIKIIIALAPPRPLKLLHDMCTEIPTFDVDNASRNYEKIRLVVLIVLNNAKQEPELL